MSDDADIDALAAEYVLGTLDATERATIAARAQREPDLARRIADWEARLGPMADLATSVPPPPELLDRIERRLDGAASPASQNATDLERRLKRWRAAAVVAGSLAACLALVIGVREATRPATDGTYVAVFQEGDAAPAFVLSIDLASRSLTLRAVGAQRQPGKSYQLWIASDRLGTAPRSLGVVDNAALITSRTVPYEPALVQAATFGVSLEPEGGSPTGLPTGPVFHARLIPASP
jgi:anti-sigma-K factor RskA